MADDRNGTGDASRSRHLVELAAWIHVTQGRLDRTDVGGHQFDNLLLFSRLATTSLVAGNNAIHMADLRNEPLLV